MKELRTKSVKIRLTEIELAQLKERQIGGELATWMREVCLGEKKRKTIKTADPELLRQLAKIGGNLNQIAKHMNTFSDQVEQIKIYGLLAEIQNQLYELLEREQ